MADEKKRPLQKLEEWLATARRVVIAGIGNPLRMDDAVGLEIIRTLQGKTSQNVYLLECETVPESFLSQIIDFSPTHVLLLDAALLGLKPGTMRFIRQENLTFSSAISTHTLPLRIFCEYLTETIMTKIGLLLIEPNNTDFGEGLTPQVAVAAQEASKTLAALFSANK
jgi:hydrogenase 3 maturation protease